MSPPVPVAISHACQACGAAIAATFAATVRCPQCQRVQNVPPEILDMLRSYQADSAQLGARLDAERSQEARWAMWYRKDGGARYGWGFSLGLAGAIGLVMGLGVLLIRGGFVDERAMGPVITGGIIGIYVLGLAFYVVRAARRKPAAPAPRPQVTAQCPLCGGALPFEFGALGRSCPHCGGCLVADAPVMNQALGAAEFQLQQARMSRHRLERTVTSRLYRQSASAFAPYIVLGSFLPMTLTAAVVATIQAASGSGEEIPLVVLVLVWTLVVVHLGALLAIYRFRAWRRRRYRALAEGAAPGLAGRLFTKSASLVWWLNSLWAGPYPVAQLLPGPYFCVVLGAVHGYPIAIDMDPVPASSEHGKPRVDVLLAARLPLQCDRVPIPQELHAHAASLGFSLASNSGGFVATGKKPPVLLGGTPDATARILVNVAYLLAECARRAGTPPTEPYPEDVG
jgi:hypothetical protein